MAKAVPRDVLLKCRKLAQLPEEARQCRLAVSITRLTVLKGLCKEAATANRFVVYLARKTLDRLQQGQGRSSHLDTNTQRLHQRMMVEAMAEMEAWLNEQTDDGRRRLRDLVGRMKSQQNEYKKIKWATVRLISDSELLLFEEVVQCLLDPAREAPYRAYETARRYTERYEPHLGTGLIPESAPLVQDIVDFWMQEFSLEPESLTAPTRNRAETKKPTPPDASLPSMSKDQKASFTHRQGQFLAFIHLYRRMHRRGPGELDLVRFFGITPPSAHGMVVKLEELGLITREPGVARSARVAIPEEEIPALEEVEGPPW